jgi:hypothetical protein
MGHLPMVMTFDRGPVLTVPGTNAARAERDLLSRLVPGSDLSGTLSCGPERQPAQAAAPFQFFDR